MRALSTDATTVITSTAEITSSEADVVISGTRAGINTIVARLAR